MSRSMTKLTKWNCAQQRHISVWASAQPGQSFPCLSEDGLSAWLSKGRLTRLGGCPGWSEYSLGTQDFIGFVMLLLISTTSHTKEPMLVKLKFQRSNILKVFSWNVATFHMQLQVRQKTKIRVGTQRFFHELTVSALRNGKSTLFKF